MELTAEQAVTINPNELRVAPDPDKVGEWIIRLGDKILDAGYEHRDHAKETVMRIIEWRRDVLDPHPCDMMNEQGSDACDSGQAGLFVGRKG
jgi:hypothetical protein